MPRESFQHLLTAWAQGHDDFPTVGSRPAPFHEAAPLEAVDQLHGGVMPDLEPFRQHPDRGLGAALEALDLQQNEVLLRLDTRCPRRELTASKKPAQLVPQIGERWVIDHYRRADAA
jgi:hypothetical protein